jgi:hypothetical protein
MVVFPAVNLVLVNVGINRYADNGAEAQRTKPKRFASIAKTSSYKSQDSSVAINNEAKSSVREC